jgi:hypothetical protein
VSNQYKKTLLVAGDSFAEFPQRVYNPVHPGLTPDKIYPGLHWCELWAKSANMHSKTSGMGGSDIHTNTHHAMHAIVKDPSITHCVYFVSVPFRTALLVKDASVARRKQKPYLRKFAGWDDEWANSHTQAYFERVPDDVLFHGSHYATLDQSDDAVYPPIDPTHVWERMDLTAREQWLTKALASISALGYLCESRGIKLLFTSGFHTGDLWKDWVENTMNLPTWVFSHTMSDMRVRSHYTQQEHEAIYNQQLVPSNTDAWIRSRL